MDRRGRRRPSRLHRRSEDARGPSPWSSPRGQAHRLDIRRRRLVRSPVGCQVAPVMNRAALSAGRALVEGAGEALPDGVAVQECGAVDHGSASRPSTCCHSPSEGKSLAASLWLHWFVVSGFPAMLGFMRSRTRPAVLLRAVLVSSMEVVRFVYIERDLPSKVLPPLSVRRCFLWKTVRLLLRRSTERVSAACIDVKRPIHRCHVPHLHCMSVLGSCSLDIRGSSPFLTTTVTPAGFRCVPAHRPAPSDRFHGNEIEHTRNRTRVARLTRRGGRSPNGGGLIERRAMRPPDLSATAGRICSDRFRQPIVRRADPVDVEEPAASRGSDRAPSVSRSVDRSPPARYGEAMLTLHNALTRAREPFAAIDPGHVRMYVCGPRSTTCRTSATAARPSCSTCWPGCCACCIPASPTSATSPTWTTRSTPAPPPPARRSPP